MIVEAASRPWETRCWIVACGGGIIVCAFAPEV